MITISQLISEMTRQRTLDVKTSKRMSWGNYAECRALFEAIFKEVDKTLILYKYLPEYDAIVDWMVDTENKGLLLMGDCGRGKSVIITGVIPVLLRMQNIVARAIHAQDLSKQLSRDNPHAYAQRLETNLDYLLRSHFPIIDDIGVENHINNFGEKAEGVNMIINTAERYHRPLFLTTNLSSQEILNRYGERTMDRLNHLCRVIEFNGESLRK
ncbi:MAG: ATP-binding protein [Rikenellaceae bacterium]